MVGAAHSGGLLRTDPPLRQAAAAQGIGSRHRRGRRLVRPVGRRRVPVDQPRPRRRGRRGRCRRRAACARPQRRADERPRRGARRRAGRAHHPAHDLVAERRVQPRRRHPDRRAHRDDDVRRHVDLVPGARLLDGVHARRPPLHLLLRRAQPLHRVDAVARRRRQHTADARRVGARRPLFVHADRALVGGEAQLRRRAQGVPDHTHRRHRADDRRHHDVLHRAGRDGAGLVQQRGRERGRDLAAR